MAMTANVNTFELQQLQQKFTALPHQLQRAVCNMETVISLAAEAQTIPLNEILPMGNEEAFECLRKLRHNFIERIIVFRSVLLPVSKDVVNGLITFLDYMEDEETFLELARDEEVSKLCIKYADEACTVKHGYETLATDLLRMGREMDVKLRKINLDVQAVLEKKKQKDELAEDMRRMSTGLTTAAALALIACGLFGPAGVLLAPELGSTVFTACCVGGAGVAASFCATQTAEEAVALNTTAATLHDAHQAAQRQLPNAVNKFAGAMGHLASFFSLLSDSVQRIEYTASQVQAGLREDHRTKGYKALHKVLLSQMSKVRNSCSSYNEFVSIVNIQVNNLQLDLQQPTLSYIESWFKEQQAQIQTRDASYLHRLMKLKDQGLKLIQDRLPGAPSHAAASPDKQVD